MPAASPRSTLPLGTVSSTESPSHGVGLGGVVGALTVDVQVELARIAELLVDRNDVLDQLHVTAAYACSSSVQVQSSPAATARSLIEVPEPLTAS